MKRIGLLAAMALTFLSLSLVVATPWIRGEPIKGRCNKVTDYRIAFREILTREQAAKFISLSGERDRDHGKLRR